MTGIVASLLLSSCGFKPRGSGYESLSDQNIILYSKNPFGELERIIKTTLAVYSVKVVSSSSLLDLKGEPDSLDDFSGNSLDENAIQINQISFEKNIISVDANGRPSEFETIITADVSLLFKGAVTSKPITSKPIASKQITHQLFIVQRDYRYDNNNSLADDRELEKLISEMYEQLANRIVAQFSRQLIENNET